MTKNNVIARRLTVSSCSFFVSTPRADAKASSEAIPFCDCLNGLSTKYRTKYSIMRTTKMVMDAAEQVSAVARFDSRNERAYLAER